MAKGRKAIAVSQAALMGIVEQIEATQSFTSRGALWAAVAQHEYCKSIGLTAQVAALRWRAWGLEDNLKTPKGQKGGFAKGVRPASVKHKRKRNVPADLRKLLISIHGEKRSKLIDRALAGSLKAAVKLKCLDCSCFQPKEITLCQIRGCPLWTFRAYQGKKDQKIALALVQKEEETHAEELSTTGV